MPTQTAEQKLETQTFDFTKQIEIAAPIEITWEAVLAELGPENQMPDGKPFPFKFEPWPGGRWFRDLGNNTGHFWAHVQVIKPPGLLELTGPMFISYPAINHVQYRLTAEAEITRLKIAHRAWGFMPKDFVKGAEQGWEFGLKRIRELAERRKK
ncbi:MAG TPA: SRPBCC domain-containing protein [Tepidisphaeraceae bacterium]|nr:SRPBCC domain-containing protein [Tepidisphaeraceae bacterium]